MDIQQSLVMIAQEKWLAHHTQKVRCACSECAWYEQRYWSEETSDEERLILDDMRKD